MLANLLFSVIALLAPALVAWLKWVPENGKWGLIGLAIGLEIGWWACHFLSTHRIALLAEKNKEKQRQWERDRIDRKEAEEKADKAAIKEAMKDVPPIVVAPFKSQFDGY